MPVATSITRWRYFNLIVKLGDTGGVVYNIQVDP